MKKSFIFVLIIFCFSSCTPNDKIIQQAIKEKESKDLAETKSNSFSTVDASSKIDIDLTKMSSTMVYATVLQMMIEPESFKGATIKASGLFNILKGPENEDVYSVIIPDATQCCQTGLSFNWDFKNKIPSQDTLITITGEFKIKEFDNGISFSYLDLSELN